MFKYGTEKRRSLEVIVFELKTGTKNVMKNGAFVEVTAMGEFCREVERTGTIFDSKNPFWEERLNLNLPEEAEKVIVRYKSVNRKTNKIKVVASLTLDISQFNSQEVREDWLTLVPETEKSSKRSIKLRLALNYMEDICLAEIDYIPTIDFLLGDMDSFLLFSTFIKKNQTDYSKVICKIFTEISPHYLNEFVKRILESEIENCKDSTVLFRANSLGSKIFEEYLGVVGQEWRASVLLPLVEEYLAFNYSFKERILQQDTSLEDIKQFCIKVSHRIFDSYETCPVEIRHILNIISTSTSEKYHDPDLTHLSISSFIILRLFTPAILCPKLFGLSVSYPTQVQTDNCSLLSSFLQKLANLTLFRENVENMHVLNDILVSEKEYMQEFVKNISQPVTYIPENIAETENMGLDYEYSLFTRYFIRNRESFNTLDRQSNIFKFSSIMDELIFKIHQEYPNYWEEQYDLDADGIRNIENQIRKREPQNGRKALHKSSSNWSRPKEESILNTSLGDIRKTKKSNTSENLKVTKKLSLKKKKIPLVYSQSDSKYDAKSKKKRYRGSSNDQLLSHSISYKSHSSGDGSTNNHSEDSPPLVDKRRNNGFN